MAAPTVLLVNDEDKVRGLTLGGDDHLVKPFSLEEPGPRSDTTRRAVAPRADTETRIGVP